MLSTLLGGNYYPHFTDKQTKAQGGYVTCKGYYFWQYVSRAHIPNLQAVLSQYKDTNQIHIKFVKGVASGDGKRAVRSEVGTQGNSSLSVILYSLKLNQKILLPDERVSTYLINPPALVYS